MALKYHEPIQHSTSEGAIPLPQQLENLMIPGNTTAVSMLLRLKLMHVKTSGMLVKFSELLASSPHFVLKGTLQILQHGPTSFITVSNIRCIMKAIEFVGKNLPAGFLEESAAFATPRIIDYTARGLQGNDAVIQATIYG